MFYTPEPFVSAEIEYRQRRVASQYGSKPRRRRASQGRHPHVPSQRRAEATVA